MSNEEKLKQAVLDLLLANDYISTNSVPGIIAGDQTHKLKIKQFAVDLDGYSQEIPKTPFYKASVVITVGTIIKNDKDRAIVSAIYEQINNTIKSMTLAQLSVAGAFKIDAIQEFSGGNASITDDMHTDPCSFTVHLQEV